MILSDKIIVVGGGTAGCISALILKTKFPSKNISIIESKNKGIVGVGESTTEHWAEFCKFIGVNKLDALMYCNATFKVGVYFENWSNQDFMHSINYPFAQPIGSYYAHLAHQISEEKPKYTLNNPSSWTNNISIKYFSDIDSCPFNQFHFDTFLLNEYLHNLCLSRGINLIDDDIISCDLSPETGNLISVKSNTQQYTADFFIDCTGFSRLILNKTYDIKWLSYAKYFPLNSAITFQTEKNNIFNKYTKSTAEKCGWSWSIPTQNRTGNGYVYSDNFCSDDDAVAEMQQKYNNSLEISKKFKFCPGRLEKSWHKNCYAVGLSQSFVEPLEATSIGSVIQQMFCFMHYLPSYDIDSCNEMVNKIFDNIVDYVQAHYLVKKYDTPFWKEVSNNLLLTDNLKSYLEKWKNRLPSASDVVCQWGLFSSVNYIQILYGLNWFDIEKIKNEYNQMELRNYVIEDLSNLVSECQTSFYMPHREFIERLIRPFNTEL